MKHRPTNVLVVDWDYFFPIEPRWDWGHSETILGIEGIWPSRAASFLATGEMLPRVDQGWTTFWDRFRYGFGAKLYYADSNVMAFPAVVGECGDIANTGIWLFDQHHDCGYQGKDSMKQIVNDGIISCENWMIPLGSACTRPRKAANLHVLYPDHHTDPIGRDPEPYFPIDRRVDDGLDEGYLPDRFDLVFVCRSGAWVPPWEDDKFFQFIESAPLMEKINTDGVCPREFDIKHAQEIADAFARIGQP